MGNTCCGPDEAGASTNDPTWRRILWIALGLNAIMFGVEIVAGIAADSRALQADALDFLGDAANYAISLGVAGMALVWRARAALVKAATMLAFGLWVLGSAIWGFFVGASPDPGTMGAIGSLALAVNLAVAAICSGIARAMRTCARCGSVRATTRSVISPCWRQRLAFSAPAVRGPIWLWRASWQDWRCGEVPRSSNRHVANCALPKLQNIPAIADWSKQAFAHALLLRINRIRYKGPSCIASSPPPFIRH